MPQYLYMRIDAQVYTFLILLSRYEVAWNLFLHSNILENNNCNIINKKKYLT